MRPLAWVARPPAQSHLLAAQPKVTHTHTQTRQRQRPRHRPDKNTNTDTNTYRDQHTRTHKNTRTTNGSLPTNIATRNVGWEAFAGCVRVTCGWVARNYGHYGGVSPHLKRGPSCYLMSDPSASLLVGNIGVLQVRSLVQLLHGDQRLETKARRWNRTLVLRVGDERASRSTAASCRLTVLSKPRPKNHSVTVSCGSAWNGNLGSKTRAAKHACPRIQIKSGRLRKDSCGKRWFGKLED